MAETPLATGRARWTLPDSAWMDDLRERSLIHARVIYAVIMRESRTRYGHSDLGYLWAIMDPLIELTIMISIFSLLGRGAGSAAPLPVFLAMGLLPFGFMRGCITRGSGAVKSNQVLLTYPQVRTIDLVLGATILEFATMLCVYILFMIGLDVIAGIPFTFWYDHPLGMSLAVISLFFFGASFAVFSSGLARLFPVWPTIFSYISRPLWFLSAIFYTLEALPTGPRRFIIYNPIAHVVEWFRSASSPVMESGAYSVAFIYVTAFIVLFLGIAIDRTLTAIGFSDRTS